jgi:hypothetical protein
MHLKMLKKYLLAYLETIPDENHIPDDTMKTKPRTLPTSRKLQKKN